MTSTKMTRPTPHRSVSRKTPRPCRAVLACAVYICLAATTGLATEYREAVDDHPQQVDANAWSFVIDLGERPAGKLQFVSAEYDFASPTQGIEVDYDFNGAGVDFLDGRTFYAIAPTLFEQVDGRLYGWDVVDINDGIFSGVVYATAPLIAVHFIIEADKFVPGHVAPKGSKLRQRLAPQMRIIPRRGVAVP